MLTGSVIPTPKPMLRCPSWRRYDDNDYPGKLKIAGAFVLTLFPGFEQYTYG
jgi:hypothetical protein